MMNRDQTDVAPREARKEREGGEVAASEGFLDVVAEEDVVEAGGTETSVFRLAVVVARLHEVNSSSRIKV